MYLAAAPAIEGSLVALLLALAGLASLSLKGIAAFRRDLLELNARLKKEQAESLERLDKLEREHADCDARCEALTRRVNDADALSARQQAEIESLKARLAHAGIHARQQRPN